MVTKTLLTNHKEAYEAPECNMLTLTSGSVVLNNGSLPALGETEEEGW